MLKKVGIAVGVLVVVAIAALVVPMAIWPTVNDVETGETPEYPDVQPQQYELDAASVADSTVDAVDELGLWELESDEEAPQRIEAIRETRIFGFVDDVTVRIDEEDGTSRVNVRSRARAGEFDYGQNARNIGEFFEALDEQIGAERVEHQ